jgi:hypothetical protein
VQVDKAIRAKGKLDAGFQMWDRRAKGAEPFWSSGRTVKIWQKTRPVREI